MEAGLKQLKVRNRTEDGSWKQILVSGGHKDQRVSESAGSICIRFDSQGVLSVRKPRVSRKKGFRGG